MLVAAALSLVAAGALPETPSELTRRLLDTYGVMSVRPSVALAEQQMRETGRVASTSPPPEDIYVQFYVEAYEPLDLKDQTWGMVGYLRAYWSDPRLRYNGTAAGGSTDALSFKVPERARIWKPEFYWEGAKGLVLPNPNAGTGELLKVYPDGSVFWSRQTTVRLACPVSNMWALPFDTQRCPWMMGMYAETAAEVVLRWRTNLTALSNWDNVCLVTPQGLEPWSTTVRALTVDQRSRPCCERPSGFRVATCRRTWCKSIRRRATPTRARRSSSRAIPTGSFRCSRCRRWSW